MENNGPLIQAYSAPIHEIAGCILDMGQYLTPERFRFIDCKAFCKEKALRIMECVLPDPVKLEHLPNYAAISYVWKGNHNPPPFESFNVKGGEDGDWVSVEVLRITCMKAIGMGAKYLWLDRVCLMQDSKIDKYYQIRNMSRIYSFCCVCLVLAGGIGGFVKADETTTWLDRSWTLQELLLPQKSYFLLKWEPGPCTLSGSSFYLEIGPEDCSEGVASIEFGDLPPIYESAAIRPDGQKEFVFFSVKFLGSARSTEITLLRSCQHTFSEPMRNIGIWRMAQKRISQRKIDVIFSIMALFSITLNPADYANTEEGVLRAEMDLIKEMTKNGQEAHWLYSSMASPSFLPTLGGDRRKQKTSEDELWYISNAPRGSLSDNGIITLQASIAPTTMRIGSVKKNMSHTRAHSLRLGRIAEISTAPRSSDGIDSSGVSVTPLEWSSVKDAYNFDAASKARPLVRVDSSNVGGIKIWTDNTLIGMPGTHAMVIGAIDWYRMEHIPPRWLDHKCTLLMLVNQDSDNGTEVWYKTGMAVVSTEFILRSKWKAQGITLKLDYRAGQTTVERRHARCVIS